jgi:hypothetical protein
MLFTAYIRVVALVDGLLLPPRASGMDSATPEALPPLG